MLRSRWFWCALWLSLPAAASAHIRLLSPTPRSPRDDLKTGPCGIAGDGRSSSVTVVRSGSTLRVEWEETVDHESHYRVSFDPDGQDDFADPASIDDRNTNDSVLIDGIADGDGPFSVDVPLPDIECENCTLQVIQVMYDKAPYEVGGNDIYYHCADLALRRDVSSATSESDASAREPTADASVPLAPFDDMPDGASCAVAPGSRGSLTLGLATLLAWCALARSLQRARATSKVRAS